MSIAKTISCMFLTLLVCIACSPSDYKFRGAAVDTVTEDGKPLYELSVNNPSLSPDGRYMAFDFHEFATINKRRIKTPISIGIYDIEKQSIELLDPPYDPNVKVPHPLAKQWHSPSFDHSGQKITMVIRCGDPACPNETYGTHIGVLDLSSKSFERVTYARQEVSYWFVDFRTMQSRSRSRVGWSQSVIRGFPVFSPDGRRIYYVSNGGAKMSSIFWQQFNADYWLNYIDLDQPSGAYPSSDNVLMNEGHGVVLFKGYGNVALIGGDRLIFSGIDALGPKMNEYQANNVSAFFYNLKTDELSVAFDNNNIPKDTRYPNKRQYSWAQSISASYDGRRIAVIRGYGNTVSLWEGGQFRDVVTAEALGVEAIQYVAISGDGSRLVVVPSHTFPETKIDSFWMVDLDSGKMESLPLRSLLRKTIDSEKPDTKV